MATHDTGGWSPMTKADRSGARILVTVRGGEQGAPEVDTVRWGLPRAGHDKCWIATDSGPEAQVTYEDDDLVAWMPLPTPTSDHGVTSADAVQPARESDFLEESGSGI
ncbi:hypothetical protein FP2506_06326 [Fulvimarina pelagi HTCC2506]|uniref:DUF551 domain-containing protein n=1 Tax=Fulvimarina pelagi HTCC2506 TaxID=314231 RepID=Q0G7D1_9HYPH|nr:hypothetical protein [Fulvimarina pelagi]EAU42433.1 hypothetical protein FP2506_06326 [Fulvimarina pelagi HTCC2506]